MVTPPDPVALAALSAVRLRYPLRPYRRTERLVKAPVPCVACGREWQESPAGGPTVHLGCLISKADGEMLLDALDRKAVRLADILAMFAALGVGGSYTRKILEAARARREREARVSQSGKSHAG
jgi:hypothetical protein